MENCAPPPGTMAEGERAGWGAASEPRQGTGNGLALILVSPGMLSLGQRPLP